METNGSGGESRFSPPPPASRRRTTAGRKRRARDTEQPLEASSSDLSKSPDEQTALTITPEIRALASGLADELFQRWELAMQQRFEEELTLRLKSELEHRQHQAAVLREEVDQRARGAFGPGGTRVVGMADLYATWERDRKLINQSREVAEMERQMAEMHERLRALGADFDESTVTVDPSEHDPRTQSPPRRRRRQVAAAVRSTGGRD